MTREEKRKALKAAVNKELRPYMRELGYAPDKAPYSERAEKRGMIGFYIRRRDGFLDELEIQWRRYGKPLFMMNFWTSDVELMKIATAHRPAPFRVHSQARIYPRHRNWLDLLARGEPWYGREECIEDTVNIARDRLGDVEKFLQAGIPSKYFSWRSRMSKWCPIKS